MTKAEIIETLTHTDQPTAVDFLSRLFSDAVDRAYDNGRLDAIEDAALLLEKDAEETFSEAPDRNMYELFYAMAKRVRTLDDTGDIESGN